MINEKFKKMAIDRIKELKKDDDVIIVVNSDNKYSSIWSSLNLQSAITMLEGSKFKLFEEYLKTPQEPAEAEDLNNSCTYVT